MLNNLKKAECSIYEITVKVVALLYHISLVVFMPVELHIAKILF